MPTIDLTEACDKSNSDSIVLYASEGKLLIISNSWDLSEALENIPRTLKIFVLLTDVCPTSLINRFPERQIQWMDSVKDIQVQGYFRQFYCHSIFA